MKSDVERLTAEVEQLKADLANRPVVWGLWDSNKQEWAIDQWLGEPAVLVFSTLRGAMQVAAHEARHGVEWMPMPYVVAGQS